ncbi:MAG: hypothetical protein ACYDHG_02080 [Desulfomonilaceae bacterium]
MFVIQDRRIKFVNKATTELTGYSEDEGGLASQAIETFIHPEDRDMAWLTNTTFADYEVIAPPFGMITDLCAKTGL